MTLFERRDTPHAFVVVSGPEIYDVYTGPDVSLPRCSCAAAIYREAFCRHQQFVRDYKEVV